MIQALWMLNGRSIAVGFPSNCCLQVLPQGLSKSLLCLGTAHHVAMH